MKNLVLLSVILLCATSGYSKRVKLPNNFVFIPSGTIETEGSKLSVNAFLMSQNEVTNAEYRAFLSALKSQGKNELYLASYPDTSAWNDIISPAFNTPFANLYFWHPAYDNYPVVNVSNEGINEYCKWLTEELRATYDENLNDVRLPTAKEWNYAARGGIDKAIYPWQGKTLRGKNGCYLANFRVIGDHNLTATENGYQIVTDSLRTYTNALETGAMYTAPTNTYNPNTFGLYNMSGNVAELTRDNVAMGGHWGSLGYDIRITSKVPFEKGNPYVGFRPVISWIKQK